MKELIKRHIYGELRESLECNPVVALIGPRQCGKSTLAKMIRAEFPASLYLDLENPFDLEKLAHPEFFLSRKLPISALSSASRPTLSAKVFDVVS